MDDLDSPRPFRRERNLSNRNFNKRNSNRRRLSTDSRNSSLDTKFPASPTNNNNNNDDDEASKNLEEATMQTALNVTTSAILAPFAITKTHTTHKSVSLDTEEKTDAAKKIYKSILKTASLDPSPTLPSNSPLVVFEQSSGEEHLHCTVEDNDVKDEYEITTPPDIPDPATLRFSQKRNLFESFYADEGILFQSTKIKSKSTQSLLTAERRLAVLQSNQGSPSPSQSSSPTSSSSQSGSYLLNSGQRLLPTEMSKSKNRHSSFHASSIDEEHTEDEVDSIKNEEVADDFGAATEGEQYVPPAMAVNQSFLTPVFQHSQSLGSEKSQKALSLGRETSLKNIDKSEKQESKEEQLESEQEKEAKECENKSKTKDFVRNFRSRPRTEIGGTQTLRVRGEVRFHSQYTPKADEPEEEEQIELRDKGYGCIQPILEELIKTEETYVENLWTGINNYGNIFERKDLPMGLRGKKYVLFGNVEQIAEFHRDEFLPMLLRNRHDLKRLFDEFQQFIEQNCFYGYVLFTMNKQRSLKLCDTYKNYFKLLQTELDDRLGINSFLVQPIQRMARYPLLLTQFIQTLFKNRDFVLKPVIESCCRLEKRLRNLLITTNESEVINDIVCINETNEFNTFYQGKFRKVSEFQVYDHSLKRSYRSKVFIFDKCIIYTEMKGKQLVFHGRYPCEHIGIVAKTKSFTLYYELRKQQECDFMADPLQIEQWLELIKEMIVQYAEEERKRLKEQLSREHGNDHMHRKPANLSLFRDSNRFSSDSGIGNIWVVPKPDHEETMNNRTTWYAVT